MKPGVLVVGVIAIVAVAAGIWWSMNNFSSVDGVSGDAPMSGTLAALVARGGNVECSVNHNGANDTTSGTVRVSGSKMRGDFSSTVTGTGAVESHMISDGEYIYVWSSAMPSGIKMKATAAGDASGDTSGMGDLYDQNYNYDCKPTTPDASLFVVPSDITFSDLSSMMQGLPAGTSVDGSATGEVTIPSGTGMSCAMCDQAPDEASKAQCKAALHCN